MDELTARQAEVLQLIADFLQATGFPPTRAEIAAAAGLPLRQCRRGASAGPGAQGLHRDAARRLARHPPAGEQLGLPVVGRVAAGSPILAEQHIQGRYQIDPALFKPRADYLLKVRGMSMRDAGILEGDLLAVHRTARSALRPDRGRAARRRGHGQALQAPGQPGATAAREPGFRSHPGGSQARPLRHRGHRRGNHSQRQDVVGLTG